jgi:DNA-binding transcriptional LysR family regulator
MFGRNQDDPHIIRPFMELRHLRYFIAVAEELHFGRAAARLHIAQPPLSQQIRALEAELGVPLFERTSRWVALTDPGHVLLEHARRVLEQVDRAVDDTQRTFRGEHGRLAVGFIVSATYEVLPRSLRAFRALYPAVELSLHRLASNEQLAALREERIQVGFLRPPVDDPALVVEVVRHDELVVALPAAHRLAAQADVLARDLASEGFVVSPRDRSPGFHDEMLRMCHDAGFSPRIIQEVEIQTVLALVAAGMGIAVVPEPLRHLHSEGLVYRRVRLNPPSVDTLAAWRRDTRSPVLRLFVECMRAALEVQPPAGGFLPARPKTCR